MRDHFRTTQMTGTTLSLVAIITRFEVVQQIIDQYRVNKQLIILKEINLTSVEATYCDHVGTDSYWNNLANAITIILQSSILLSKTD
jgi:hypothetical protein